jgi:hypothetical protein
VDSLIKTAGSCVAAAGAWGLFLYRDGTRQTCTQVAAKIAACFASRMSGSQLVEM